MRLKLIVLSTLISNFSFGANTQWRLIVKDQFNIINASKILNDKKYEVPLKIKQTSCVVSELGKSKKEEQTRMLVCNFFDMMNRHTHQIKSLAACNQQNNKAIVSVHQMESKKNAQLIILECKKNG